MRLILSPVLVAVLVGCGGSSSSGGTNTSVYTSVTITTSSANAYEFAANPTVLHVTAHDQNNADMPSAGGTTVWHVTPTGTPFSGSAVSGAPGSSNTATAVFAVAGSFDYQCDVHGPAMSGTIVVH